MSDRSHLTRIGAKLDEAFLVTENRIGSVFGAAPQGYKSLSLLRSLPNALLQREMERETYEIDGVDTAPALYTVFSCSSRP